MPSITVCTVTGNVLNLLGSNVSNCKIRATIPTPFFHPVTNSWISGELASVLTDSSGNFSLGVIETETPGTKVTFTFEYYDGVANRRTKAYAVVVPNSTSALLANLVVSTTLPSTITTLPAQNVTVLPTISNLPATDAYTALSSLQSQVTTLGTAVGGALSSSLNSGQIYLGNAFNTAQAVTPTGDVTITNAGITSVAFVGGSSAANLHSAELAANSAVSTNTVSTIVKRDASGNFSAGTITAALSGNATTATTAAGLSSTLLISSGGTGQTSASAAFNALSPVTTLGDIVYGSATNTNSRLAGNTTSTKKFLTQTGTGTVSAAPSWGTIAGSDLPNPSASTLGGVQSAAPVSNQWINSISTSGVPALSQPAFSNLSGQATLAQLPSIANNTILGNNSGSTGVPIALTATQVNTMLSSVSPNLNVVSKTANFTATSSNDLLLCDSSGGAFAITLPAASGNSGKVIRVHKTDTSLNAVTIQRAGSDTVETASMTSGATSTTANTYGERVTLVSDGTSKWYVIDRTYPTNWVAYTPTLTGFGTPSSVAFYSRRNGSGLDIRGGFVSGTSTAVGAAFTLGFNGGNSNVTTDGSSTLTDATVCGWGGFNVNGATAVSVLGRTGQTFANFGVQDAAVGHASTSVVTANSTVSSGQGFYFFCHIPIAGWN